MVQLSFNSASVALLSAVIVVVIAVFVCYAKRILIRNKLVNALTLLGVSGFVLPGTIIALGVMIPLVWIDNHINLISERFFDTTLGLIITGSILGLLIAHTIRFLPSGFISRTRDSPKSRRPWTTPVWLWARTMGGVSVESICRWLKIA